MENNPLVTTSLGAVILLMAGAIRVLYKDNRRLNSDRLQDMKEIGEADRKIIEGVTKALTNLKRKIDGIGSSNDKAVR